VGERPTSDARRGWPLLGGAAALAAAFAIVAPAPFLGEDWIHLGAMGSVASLASALDPAREPLRPFQHGIFWLLAHSGWDPAGGALPAVARAFAFALHALACAAVYGLARTGGLGRGSAAVASALFAVFPNVKMLAWPAAIGSPGRVALELVGLLLFARRLGGGAAWTGAGALAAFALALGFHESAFLLPVLVLAWAASAGTGGLRAGLGRAAAALRDPFVFAALAVAIGHVVHLAFFRPQRHHGFNRLASFPANGVKASLSLAPEWLREIGVEGLRGHRGTIGWIAGVTVLALVALTFALALRRGGLARFAALAALLDLGLAVVAVGFVQRYACLAAACLALPLAAWARSRSGAAVVIVLAASWAADSAHDALEFRAAGRAALRVAADARALRAELGAAPAMLLDLPDMVGSEQDVPFFAEPLLAAYGAAGPWRLARTRPFRTTTSVELVDDARIDAALAAGVRVFEFDGRGLAERRRAGR